jgi:hypothetical protein
MIVLSQLIQKYQKSVEKGTSGNGMRSYQQIRDEFQVVDRSGKMMAKKFQAKKN